MLKLLIIIELKMKRTAIHPGEILKDELDELELSASSLAEIIGVPANRVTQIISGKRSISADTALRLGQYFGMSADFWLNLQKMYELDTARKKIGSSLKRIPQRKQVI